MLEPNMWTVVLAIFCVVLWILVAELEAEVSRLTQERDELRADRQRLDYVSDELCRFHDMPNAAAIREALMSFGFYREAEKLYLTTEYTMKSCMREAIDAARKAGA